jgi:site-specific recombinase XerD
VRLEIYDYERRLKRILERLGNLDTSRINKRKITEFYQELLTQGLSKARIIKYLDTLKTVTEFLDKDFQKATREDIAELVRKIEEKDYSEWTKRDFKVILKIFFRWLRRTEDYPEEVRWIKANAGRNKALPEELLTEDEVKRMVNDATNPRDKAFILVLYESGCRVGEILSLRIRNVQFDEYGAQLIVHGKTGMRRVRIIASAPALGTWLDNHPLKEDPDSPLWMGMGTRNRNSILSYAAAKEMLKDIAKRAGIKKRVYPHLFRHSRATVLANHLTEAQLKQHFGWVQDSKMAATYVHLSGREVDDTLLKLQGVRTEEGKKESEFKVITCPRCDEKNSPTSKFCSRCAAPFDLKIATKIDEVKAKADRVLALLVQDPEILDKLLDKLEQLKSTS